VPKLEANGINIYYEVLGSGETLLVIAGLSIDLTAIHGIASELSKSYRVITFDNRGAGRSDKSDIPYSIEMMAEDTAGLLDGLSIPRVHVMGISLGGRIAMALALKHPERVKSLILVSTGAKVPKTQARRLLLLLLDFPRRIAALGKQYPQPDYAYRRQRKASQEFDATDRLEEIRVPTLILHGKSDRLAPYGWAENMHDRIVGSKIVAFKGGHMFLFWRQREFVDAVTRFLGPQTANEPTRS
jgi:3-oxoadipate enol-lactonase